MSDVDSVLVNKLSQFNSDEINKVTRDIMHAYKTSAKLKCVSNSESDYFVLGNREIFRGYNCLIH